MNKIFRHTIWLSIIAAISLLLNGCSHESVVKLFNNSGSAAEITFDGKKITLEKNASYEFEWGDFVNGVAVQIDGKTSIYKISPMDGRKTFKLFKHKTGLDILTVQLNSDGPIYVVAPDAVLPATEYPKQPDNFPLQPSK